MSFFSLALDTSQRSTCLKDICSPQLTRQVVVVGLGGRMIVPQAQTVPPYTQASGWLKSVLKILPLYARYLLFRSPQSAGLTNDSFLCFRVFASCRQSGKQVSVFLCEPCDLLEKIPERTQEIAHDSVIHSGRKVTATEKGCSAVVLGPLCCVQMQTFPQQWQCVLVVLFCLCPPLWDSRCTLRRLQFGRKHCL